MTTKVESVHCNRCLRVTAHLVLLEKQTECRDDVDEVGHAIASSGMNWKLYECRGCENIVLRRRFWHTDMDRGESEGEECYNTWYPSLVGRQIPTWHKKLGDTERRLITEIYTALHAKAFALTLMGLRALLDVYMVKKVGDSGTFKSKLAQLVRIGSLSAAQLQQIEPALEAGSAAAHRGFDPSSEAVTFVLDVVELLLHQDLLGSQVSQIIAGIPPRSVR